MGAEPVLEHEDPETTNSEPVGHLPALKIGGQMGIGATGQYNHRRPVAMTLWGIENAEGGNIFAGAALGLRGIAGPEPNGLDSEPGVVLAGSGTWLRLRLRSGAGQKASNQ